MLGLLALLLGFNFAMAASRFETRKALLQDEVEAINSAYLRGQLLQTPQKEKVSSLIRTYIDTRIDFALAGSDDALIDKASLSALRIERQLWEMTSLMMTQDSFGPSTSLFAESVNEVVNINLKRRAAIDNHVPQIVIHLLFLVAVGAMGFIAYGYGLSGKRRHVSTAIFAVLIALVLTIILVLDQPRSGFIRVDEQSILRLKGTIGNNSGSSH